MIAAFAVPFPAQLIAPALALLLGSCLLVRGVLQLARTRLKAVATSKIASVSRGQVEIHGTATGPYSITAPISGKSCYLYRTAVWQQRSRSDGWAKLVEETLHVPFYLDDSTGQLLIEPMGAELEIPVNSREEFGGSVFSDASTIPPAVSAFLARHRTTPTNHILIEEFCVEPQTDLFVTGPVTDNPGVEVKPLFSKKASGIRPGSKVEVQPQPEVVRLSDASTPPAPDAMTLQSKIAAALVKAGIQNPNAWTAAGVPYPGPSAASATAVLHQENGAPVGDLSAEKTETPSGFDLKPALVLMKGSGESPFVISSRKSQQPRQHGSLQELILLGVGGVLTLASLWILLRTLP